MVTLKDIALHCGVSVASVSKAINHMPGVGQRTAQRIRETAKAFGYLPNAAAQALRTNRSFNIGVILVDDDNHTLLNEFFVLVLEGFKMKMEEEGYDLMLLNRTIGRRKISYLEHCRHSNLDGVFAACTDFSDKELLALAASDIPIVSVDHTYPGHPSVYSDNEGGIYQAVSYAHAQGHRNIALILGGPAGVTDKRLKGYQKALKDLGLEARTEYLKHSRYRDIKRTYEATQQLLALKEPPTCILMPDDYASHGGMLAIKNARLKVPQDISVIGFDGIEYFKYITPRLTTVVQDAMKIGEAAANLLRVAIENKGQAAHVAILTIPTTFIKGETVAHIKI